MGIACLDTISIIIGIHIRLHFGAYVRGGRNIAISATEAVLLSIFPISPFFTHSSIFIPRSG